MQRKTKIAAVTASVLVVVVLAASTVIAATQTGIAVEYSEIPVIVSVSVLVWWICFELMRFERRE